MKFVLDFIENKSDRQQVSQAGDLRNEKIRLAILCGSLGALALAFALYLFTQSSTPLFITIVVTFLGYQHLDTALRKNDSRLETSHSPEASSAAPQLSPKIDWWREEKLR